MLSLYLRFFFLQILCGCFCILQFCDHQYCLIRFYVAYNCPELKKTDPMKLRSIFYHLFAMAIAYAVVLLLPMIFDFAFETNVELIVIGWLNLGMMVMIAKGVEFPKPDTRRIDVVGALNTFWWALFWPKYLFNGK